MIFDLYLLSEVTTNLVAVITSFVFNIILPDESNVDSIFVVIVDVGGFIILSKYFEKLDTEIL